MKLFWKKKELPVTNDTKEVDVVQLWHVRWRSRHGQFSSDTREELEGFPSLELANEFADSLKAAFKLLKHTSDTAITVEKN